MKRLIEGEARTQVTLLLECLDDYVAEENRVRVVDFFVDERDLGAPGFEGVDPAATDRPAYLPSELLKIYIYGYLNRIQSSRRLEREAERNVDLMWLRASQQRERTPHAHLETGPLAATWFPPFQFSLRQKGQ
ncbi:transposase [Pseudomonas sp. WS 5071]|uniref:transposase n=1 Tax=Pseudomonas sp. WS 5071 TaxID=2717479 RepID=UPI0021D10D57|nr:transposase [Pseudomonas sp. WS 5071]